MAGTGDALDADGRVLRRRGQAPVTDGWLHRRLDPPPAVHRINVLGAGIEVRVWGERGRPGLLFVHGMLAHASWWDFIAPAFAERFRCAAFSLSGMGGSDWREAYSMLQYAAEMEAVLAGFGLHDGPRRPVVLAHSFGAFAARRLAEARGGVLGGLVLIDSQVRESADYVPPKPREHPLKRYESIEAAIARFRLAPEQPCANSNLMAYIARAGLKPDGDGWVWRFDPELRSRLVSEHYHAGLNHPGCPVAFVWGDESVVINDRVRAHVRGAFPAAPIIEIADSGHHIMLDQPQALIDALDALLSWWPAETGLG